MAKKKQKNALLSSLEEIKQGSLEELPREPAPEEAPAPRSRPAPKASLLDSLLDEVKAEADREVEEITKTLEEKTAAERKLAEDEEQRKKEQYDVLIQDEARRRLQMIKRKEDEKRGKVLEAEQLVAKRKEMERQQVQQKKTRKGLLVASGIAMVGLAAMVALVLTGVIPLLEDKTPVVEQAADEVATKQMKKSVPVEKPVEEYKGPPIDEPSPEPPMLGVSGPASAVLDLPKRTDPALLARQDAVVTTTAPVHIESDLMATRLAKAFARSSGSSGGSSGSSDPVDSGGIKIDDSIFKD
jgi:hypothetical protein